MTLLVILVNTEVRSTASLIENRLAEITRALSLQVNPEFRRPRIPSGSAQPNSIKARPLEHKDYQHGSQLTPHFIVANDLIRDRCF